MDPLGWAGLLSPVGCVIYLVVALSRGWLVSGREMDRHERLWEARLTEAHGEKLLWQKTAETASKAAETTEETRRDVADQLRTRQIVDEAVVRALSPFSHLKEPQHD